MKIGLIGYGNHAKKIEKILLKSNYPIQIYIINSRDSAQKIDQDTNAVFICSPNSTHNNYINKALEASKKLFIYCEKPLFNKSENYNSIVSAINSNRIFPGFNLRRSSIVDIIKDYNGYFNLLGNIRSIRIIKSYPFGLKDTFVNSWKSMQEFSPLGIFENLSIHYVDLCQYLFGKISNPIIELSDCTKNIPMTSDCIFRHKNGIVSYIHNSYVEPVCSEFKIFFENGYIDFKADSINYYSPTLNIEEKTGLCINSNLIHKIKPGIDKLHSDSLEKSVLGFLKIIQKGNFSESIDDSKDTTLSTIEIINSLL